MTDLSCSTSLTLSGKVKKWNNVFHIYRTDSDKELPESALLRQYLKLNIRYIIGDHIEKDCSCYSKYVFAAMGRVGTAMRHIYVWVR